MTTGIEKKQILDKFNDTDAPYPEDKTLHQLFEEQVRKTPENPAVLFKDQRLSYREFNEKADSLACLLKERGVGPDTVVGIMTERSLEMMVGLMAILKAGAAYLPIDPHYPQERVNYMLKDSNARVLLSEVSELSKVSEGTEVVTHLTHPTHPTHLCYVIYTSGSTGRPKGVMVEHHSVVNRLHWMQKRYPLDETDTILQKTPFIFDVSVWELFWWSLVGAKVCFLLPGFEKFPQAIVETVERQKVTTMHFVPSMMSAFLGYIENSGDIKRLGSLKRVFVSGEALKPIHLERFNRTLYRENGTRLINLYGPTETTVDVSYFDCPTGSGVQQIPIGKPIDNIGLYIMDNDLQLQPVGTEGELCISGVGLARGYLNRPELTAEKFVLAHSSWLIADRREKRISNSGELPMSYELSAMSCLYKTGDLAYWLPDGNIAFVGRMDHQVKIRGLRIELGEIESVLAQHPAVQDCVVIVRETTETIITLVACMVIKPGEQVTDQELKKHMKSFLPDYMVPGEWIRMETLPQTPSGKVDRKRLSEESDE
ncbi:MAG: amino acid adenylation domain-containing protein [Candidatus Aminicenantes bacterium]|nr:amino acid adenylation domain-containing protein [Candidatus Aminicenantes bacterium]NIM82192.1 amino acid adenylation domain-containing protein [Candidatus Aminicenantes bacterium]NIN21594.1 amino acid adenylation domain-containing protein [Candidatus Aminicenantes bacterium]NIN45403.1 amino acid adenylation domain-containing protein [Candidatus Aminicenantes bacterium]NIN88224.1 amino acid adenylation domain-containing protein [Candidatus Aminicenantes bacterium]